MIQDVLTSCRAIGLGIVVGAAWSAGQALSGLGGGVPVAELEWALLSAAAAVPPATVVVACIVGRRSRVASGTGA